MLLNKYSLPAERERGCVFAEKFENAAEVVRNGGTITGTPVINQGVTLDGSSDYITYNIPANLLDKAEFSSVVRFTPDFNYDADATYRFFDSSVGSFITFRKRDNADNNTLTLDIHGTSIAAIAEATYSAYWNVGVENILTITSTTGDTSVWLNGTQILTNDVTAWTEGAITEFYIGARRDGAEKFDGIIHEVKLFTTQLTDQEALDYSNGGGFWNYGNETDLNVPGNLENHDPTNVRALDISGNATHGTFGDGSTSTTYPTKLTTAPGYDYDGGDYLDFGNILPSASSAFTMSIWIENDDTTDGDIFGKFGTDLKFLLFNTATGELRFYSGSAGSVNNAARWTARTLGDKQHIAGVYDGTNTILYVNGVQIATAVTPVAPVASTDNLRIGVRSGGASFFDGRAWNAKIWDTKALTPIQIKDLYLRELKQINDI
uniref:Putative lectin/glucanase superfamily protein n=1 Tax=viral metagenome TaxID=1070528 RepID=A0A6M3J829_9ZZZZ